MYILLLNAVTFCVVLDCTCACPLKEAKESWSLFSVGRHEVVNLYLLSV